MAHDYPAEHIVAVERELSRAVDTVFCEATAPDPVAAIVQQLLRGNFKVAAPEQGSKSERLAALREQVAGTMQAMLDAWSTTWHDALTACATLVSDADAADAADAAYQVAELLNAVYGPLRRMLDSSIKSHTKLRTAVTDEALHELKLSTSVVSISESRVECEVEWQAPLEEPAMLAAKKALAEVQAELERAFASEAARALPTLELARLPAAQDAAAVLKGKLSDEVMPHLADAVDAVECNTERCWVTLPAVIRELLPKYANVYAATAEGLVKKEAGFAEYNVLEAALFSELRAAKMQQPVASLVDLLALSVRAKPTFDALMRAVADKAGKGVSWQPAPLKKALRIVEKLSLDPKQRQVSRRGVGELDTSCVMDTVRGMFVVDNMGGAVRVLRAVGFPPP